MNTLVLSAQLAFTTLRQSRAQTRGMALSTLCLGCSVSVKVIKTIPTDNTQRPTRSTQPLIEVSFPVDSRLLAIEQSQESKFFSALSLDAATQATFRSNMCISLNYTLKQAAPQMFAHTVTHIGNKSSFP